MARLSIKAGGSPHGLCDNFTMNDHLRNEFADLSDDELVAMHGQIGDPFAYEVLKAEERRRTADKALKQAKISNWIAIASLLIAIGSMAVAAF